MSETSIEVTKQHTLRYCCLIWRQGQSFTMPAVIWIWCGVDWIMRKVGKHQNFCWTPWRQWLR